MRKDWIIGVLLLFLIVGIFFDKQIVNFVVGHRMYFLNPIMQYISLIGSAFFVFLFSTLVLVFDKKGRKYIPALWLTIILTLGIVYLLKILIARPRPLVNTLENISSYAFPSGHAAGVFAPLLLIDKFYPKIKWIWLGFAVLVLFSIIYLGVHYLSDVIGGALIGYLLSIFVLRFLKISF